LVQVTKYESTFSTYVDAGRSFALKTAVKSLHMFTRGSL